MVAFSKSSSSSDFDSSSGESNGSVSVGRFIGLITFGRLNIVFVFFSVCGS